MAAAAYGVPEISERHRHRWEFNNDYRAQFEQGGMRFSGLSPTGQLVEIAEIIDHPFMLGSQFHPEFLSRPNRPHPLFRKFIETIIAQTVEPIPEIMLETVPEAEQKTHELA